MVKMRVGIFGMSAAVKFALANPSLIVYNTRNSQKRIERKQ